MYRCLKKESFSRALRPIGRRWSLFLWTSARHQFLHCENTDTSVSRNVPVYIPAPWNRYQIILLGDRGTCVWTTCLRSLPGSVAVRSRTCASEQGFQSKRLGVNTPKNFSPHAQILRRGRHDVQKQSASYYVYLSIINWKLTSESVFECFVGLKKFRWLSCFWILHFMKTRHATILI